MAGKARVHELAKELGVTSKEVLARLSEQGEFVKSASSTVEAPVARRLRESFGGAKPAAREGQGRRQRLAGQGRRGEGRAREGARRQARGTRSTAPRGPRGTAGSARRGCGRGSGGGTGPPWLRLPAQRLVRGPAPRRLRRSPPRVPRASATTRSPRRSRLTGRFRVRRHPVRVPRGPACRRAICPRVRVDPRPAPSGRPGGRPARPRRRPARPRWSWSRCRHRRPPRWSRRWRRR